MESGRAEQVRDGKGSMRGPTTHSNDSKDQFPTSGTYGEVLAERNSAFADVVRLRGTGR